MKSAFQRMKEELLASYPETCKVPGRFGGYVRVPVEQNAHWYRVLCARYHRPRNRPYSRPRTIIRRVTTLKALDRMIAGNLDGVYAERLLKIAKELFQKPKRRVPCPF